VELSDYILTSSDECVEFLLISRTTYDAGPMLEPCITLAVIADTVETLPRYRVQCEWPLKKLTSQGCAIVSSRVE